MTRLIPLSEAKKIIASVPISTFEPGETVLPYWSNNGQMFVLKHGLVEIIVDGGISVAKVSEPGVQFGRGSFAFDVPDDFGIRAVVRSEFHVASQSSMPAESYVELRKMIRHVLASDPHTSSYDPDIPKRRPKPDRSQW
jgi:CRP/FNR family transcriptional regulator, cyclic AMP receptor protein